MSDFLSNIVSRHSSSEQVIQPRAKSLFETHQPPSSSFQSSSAIESFDPIPSPRISEEKIQTPQLNDIPENRISNDVFSEKNDASIMDEQRKNSTKNEDRFTKGMSFKEESFPIQKAELPPEKGQLKIQNAGEGILNETFNKLQHQKLDRKVSIPDSEVTDSKKVTPNFSERTMVQPSQVINKQLISNFNHNTQIELNSKSDSAIETSHMPSTPTIKIHIGRIDIKAVKPGITATKKIHKTNSQAMSLDQFLKKREGK